MLLPSPSSNLYHSVFFIAIMKPSSSTAKQAPSETHNVSPQLINLEALSFSSETDFGKHTTTSPTDLSGSIKMQNIYHNYNSHPLNAPTTQFTPQSNQPILANQYPTSSTNQPTSSASQFPAHQSTPNQFLADHFARNHFATDQFTLQLNWPTLSGNHPASLTNGFTAAILPFPAGPNHPSPHFMAHTPMPQFANAPITLQHQKHLQAADRMGSQRHTASQTSSYRHPATSSPLCQSMVAYPTPTNSRSPSPWPIGLQNNVQQLSTPISKRYPQTPSPQTVPVQVASLDTRQPRLWQANFHDGQQLPSIIPLAPPAMSIHTFPRSAHQANSRLVSLQANIQPLRTPTSLQAPTLSNVAASPTPISKRQRSSGPAHHQNSIERLLTPKMNNSLLIRGPLAQQRNPSSLIPSRNLSSNLGASTSKQAYNSSLRSEDTSAEGNTEDERPSKKRCIMYRYSTPKSVLNGMKINPVGHSEDLLPESNADRLTTKDDTHDMNDCQAFSDISKRAAKATEQGEMDSHRVEPVLPLPSHDLGLELDYSSWITPYINETKNCNSPETSHWIASFLDDLSTPPDFALLADTSLSQRQCENVQELTRKEVDKLDSNEANK